MLEMRSVIRLSEKDSSFVVSQLSFWKKAVSILVFAVLGLAGFSLFLTNFSSVLLRKNTLTDYTMSTQKIAHRLSPAGCVVFTTNSEIIAEEGEISAASVNMVDRCFTVE